MKTEQNENSFESKRDEELSSYQDEYPQSPLESVIFGIIIIFLNIFIYFFYVNEIDYNITL